MNHSRNKAEVILAVDSHLDAHVGALLNLQGHLLGGYLTVATNSNGYDRLVASANPLGHLKKADVVRHGYLRCRPGQCKEQ